LRLDEKAGGELTPIYSASLSPDGRLLAIVDCLSRLWPWEVASGKKLPHLEVRRARFATFSADGKVLAVVIAEPEVRKLHKDGKVSPAASAGDEERVSLWEVTTGRSVCTLSTHNSAMGPAAFAQDGKTLAGVGDDGTAIVWRLAGPTSAARIGAVSSNELASLWKGLASDNALKAREAITSLGAAPEQAVPFLQKRLQPVSPKDIEHIVALIRDLDSARFAAREKSAADIRKAGKLAEPALRRTLAGNPPLEVRQRVERLLEDLKGATLSPEEVRALRAIEALERAGTPEAIQALQAVAKGVAEARQTQEAKAALDRLGQRHRPESR
jgi:hypothetical protein